MDPVPSGEPVGVVADVAGVHAGVSGLAAPDVPRLSGVGELILDMLARYCMLRNSNAVTKTSKVEVEDLVRG